MIYVYKKLHRILMVNEKSRFNMFNMFYKGFNVYGNMFSICLICWFNMFKSLH